MNSTKIVLPLIISALAGLNQSAQAVTVGKPFLNQVSCPVGFVPGTPKTGCVKDMNVSNVAPKASKRESAREQVGAGVSTVAQTFPNTQKK
jgi:hypothetical protein